MAKEKSNKGEAIQPGAGAPGDRRSIAGLRATSGQITITAGKRSASAGKDSTAPGAKAAQANSGRVIRDTEISAGAFIALVNKGIMSWLVAGELLAVWKKMEPNCFRLIINEAPWISMATLEMFERIGNRTLFPKVLLLPPMLAERVGRLSYADQEKMCAQPESTIRASVRSATHKDRGRDSKRPGPAPQERSHIATLPCAGYFKVLVVGGKASVCKCDKTDRAIPVVLDDSNCVVLQILSRHGVQSESDQTPDGTSLIEKQWREFKAEQQTTKDEA